MAFNSSGQVSYLVLDSLMQGSKYGLEIIEYISAKTGGNYIMKKPTLYSCLTRMEKKGLVSSSFWGESELGGKRHYYTITTSGKREYEQLAADFENASYTQDDEEPQESEEQKPVFLQQDSLFNMVKEEKPQPVKEEEPQSDVVENQMDIFSMPQQSEEKTDEEKMEYYENKLQEQPQKDDAVFLDADERVIEEKQEQNKRLYDSANEFNKYRKRKSFSENQIEMSVVYESAEDQEMQRQRIEQLKSSLLSARENHHVEEPPAPVQEETVKESAVDDAIFITEPKINESEIPVQRKITPPNIDIDVTSLPAPKRDTNLEPTYKDMMSKLFERKKEKASPVKEPVKEESENYNDMASFVDYNSLKSYYNGHGIEFKEYKKTNVERIHNTNFLTFISSAILLLLSGVGCAVLFGIICGANLLSVSSNFLFYTVPILFLIHCIVTFIIHKTLPSKKASLTYNAVVNWAVFVLGCVVVLVANVIAGMQYETFSHYLTSLLVPIFAILLAFPINYYIKKFLFKRYAK